MTAKRPLTALTIRDAATDHVLCRAAPGEIVPPRFGVHQMDFTPDGRHVILAAYDTDGDLPTRRLSQLSVIESTTGRLVRILTVGEHFFGSHARAFSRDGSRLAVRYHVADRPGPVPASHWQGRLAVWDLTSGRKMFSMPVPPRSPCAINPDGTRVAAVVEDNNRGQSTRLWEADSGREVLTIPGFGQTVSSVAFSPDGRQLAVSGSERRAGSSAGVKIFDAATGKEELAIRGRFGFVRAVAFSPDGRRLAGDSIPPGLQDAELRLWDARTGRELLILRHSRALNSKPLFVPDGHKLFMYSWNAATEIRVWDATPLPPKVEAQPVVEKLIAEGLLKDQLRDRLKADDNLSDAERRVALEFAERALEDPGALGSRARKLARNAGLPDADYTLALRLAEAARAAGPDDPAVLGTLGVAQYRAGQHAAAVTTLARCLEVYGPAYDWDLTEAAFLALAHQRLGQKELAMTYADRVRARAEAPVTPADEDLRGLLREFEALGIGTKGR
jgi:dipeptidyl aminopeptidase/acylaminoacyl peptidase